MATHSSVFAWRTRDGGAWWAAVSGVAQSRTQLKQLSSRTIKQWNFLCHHCNQGLRELETVRIKLVKDFIDEPMLVAKFPHPLNCTVHGILQARILEWVQGYNSGDVETWQKALVHQ